MSYLISLQGNGKYISQTPFAAVVHDLSMNEDPEERKSQAPVPGNSVSLLCN